MSKRVKKGQSGRKSRKSTPKGKKHSSSRTDFAKDPYGEREASRYENPIPSREYILQILEENKGPMEEWELVEVLQLTEEDQLEGLRRRLNAMNRDGQLIRNRREGLVPASKTSLIHCRVIGHRDGFGFASPLEGGDDLYLHNRQMRNVFDGDEVLVRIKGKDFRGRSEAAIAEIVKRNTTELVGRYYKESGVAFLEPDNPNLNQNILLPPDLVEPNHPKPKAGQIVSAKIHQYPDTHQMATAVVTEVLGDELDPGMEIEMAVRNHNIPHQWPEGAQQEADKLPDQVQKKDLKGRLDLRHLPFVTIDGEDARDFDDAVYCEPTRTGGWKLWVAIADVSHYVKVNSALDEEARNRGTSVYFPGSVVPMLPEKISNGLCSLNPNVDRLTMVCEMSISAQGNISRYRFAEGIIHSHARHTYTQVGKALSESNLPDSPARKDIAEVLPQIDTLFALYQTLVQKRKQRGAIEFETQETRIIFDKNRKIKTIVPVQRNDAHKLIEECMLAANVCAAKLLQKELFENAKMPGLFRVHEGPSEKKLDSLHDYLGEMGLSLPGAKKPKPEDYQQLLQQVSERPDAKIIQTMLLRSMSQAVYQPENIGHFGLNYPHYAHFTSPIRRYPDLLVHRAIRYLIQHKQSSHLYREEGCKPIAENKIYPYKMAEMLQLGEHCSATERRADEASRDVTAWLKCEYLQQHIGSTFKGLISGVTSFGFFVELNDLYVEGLVHISSLKNDYFQYDAKAQRLIGERSHQTYKLGDEVSIQLQSVNLDERKVDFELLDLLGRPGGRIRKRKKTSDQNKRDNYFDDEQSDSKPKKKKDKAKNKAKTKNKSKSKKGKASKRRHNDNERGAHPSKKSKARKGNKSKKRKNRGRK